MPKLFMSIVFFSIALASTAQSGYGCTDSAASNYNPEATINDGSCCYNLSLTISSTVEGSVVIWNNDLESEFQEGYFPGANQFCIEASCITIYIVNNSEMPTTYTLVTSTGENVDLMVDPNYANYWIWNSGEGLTQNCNDPWACNYSPTAECGSDYTCTYDCWGCTNPEAINFNPEATIDDGTCCLNGPGCLDPAACNYDANAECDYGIICTYECYGCIDETAPNYNPEATLDDGSCCTNENYASFICNAAGYFHLNNEFVSEFFYIPEPNVPYYLCIPDGCYYFSFQAFGVGSNQTSYTLTRNGEVLLETFQIAAFSSQELSINPTYGCTDSEACNYDPTITCSDLTICNYDCYGCMDPAALNYNPESTLDDNFCCYAEYTIIAEESAYVTGCWATNVILETGIYPELNTFCVPNDCFKITYQSFTYSSTEVTIVDQNGEIMFIGMTDENGFIEIGFDMNGIVGCASENACNYNPEVTCHLGSSCIFDCYGCMDPTANNYDPEATLSGFCCYNTWINVETSVSCAFEFEYINFLGESYTINGFYPNNNGFCVNADYCFHITFFPIDEQELNYSLFDFNGSLISSGIANYGIEYTHLLSGNLVTGCNDASACNFDPLVNCADINTCEYYCGGCTDTNALNFSSEAQFDDGSCIYEIEAPSITFQTELDELLDAFYIFVDIQSLGNGAPYIMSNSFNEAIVVVDEIGNYDLGPFPCDQQVIVYLHSAEFEDLEYAESEPFQVNCTNAVNQISTSTELKIFPNPSTGQFTIQGLGDGNWQMTVTDITGRAIVSKMITTLSNQILVDLSELAAGNYQMTCSNTTQAITSRIAIQR